MVEKELMERITKLYSDWLSTKNNATIIEMNSIMSRVSKGRPALMSEAIEIMEADGKTLDSIIKSSAGLVGDSLSKIKMDVAEVLKTVGEKKTKKDGTFYDEFRMTYTPITDRSNAMETKMEPNELGRDLLIQIRNATSGGNMAIAAELIKNGWGMLSLKERNDLIEWVNNIGLYGSNPDIPRSKAVKLVQMKKLSDVTKDDFADGFVRTALENMKVS